MFFKVVAAMLARKADVAREAVRLHLVKTHGAADEVAARKEALLKKAFMAKEEVAAAEAWAAWEREGERAEQAAVAAAAERGRLEAEVERIWGRWRVVAQRCRRPTRRLRTRGAAIAAAIEGLETALEELGGSCGGSMIYEEQMEKLLDDSISTLSRLMKPGEFADLIEEYSLEEYLDEE